jgi:hypothetical protein
MGRGDAPQCQEPLPRGAQHLEEAASRLKEVSIWQVDNRKLRPRAQLLGSQAWLALTSGIRLSLPFHKPPTAVRPQCRHPSRASLHNPGGLKPPH